MPTSDTAKTHGGDLRGRKVLFIAYFFPPTVSTGVPGSMRIVKFLRNLSNGECHVLTGPATIDKDDDALAHLTLPVNGEVIHRIAPWDVFKSLLAMRKRLNGWLRKSPATSQQGAAPAQTSTFKSAEDKDRSGRNGFQRLKDFIYDLCYFPDQAGPWILPAARYGKKLVRNQRIDVIFATGSPWSGLITGYLISKATGKPLIVDFRDPWRNNPFHQSKGRFLDRWSDRLERQVVEHASAVSLNTEPLLEEFLERYPEQSPEKFFVIPNGFDERDFSKLDPEPRSDTDLLLTHAGFLYGVRNPAALLDAVRQANAQLETRGGSRRIVFRQIGAVQLDYDLAERYRDLLQAGQLLIEDPLPYLQCLTRLASSDIVVNVQPGTRTQVPSKLYDYLGLGRPILHLTPPDGALGLLVGRYDLGALADFTERDRIVDYLLTACADNSTPEFRNDYVNARLFSIGSISSDLARVIVTLSKGRRL